MEEHARGGDGGVAGGAGTLLAACGAHTPTMGHSHRRDSPTRLQSLHGADAQQTERPASMASVERPLQMHRGG